MAYLKGDVVKCGNLYFVINNILKLIMSMSRNRALSVFKKEGKGYGFNFWDS